LASYGVAAYLFVTELNGGFWLKPVAGPRSAPTPPLGPPGVRNSYSWYPGIAITWGGWADNDTARAPEPGTTPTRGRVL